MPGPVWPAHEILRSWGLRLLGVVVLASPILLWWKARGSREAWLASAAALLLLLRGDVAGITASGAICGIAWAMASVPHRRHYVALVALALLVPAAENLWLAARSGRPELERWESPRVGVRLATHRAAGLQAAIRELHLHDDQPALIWPDLGGLHFLLGSAPRPCPIWARGDDARTARALAALAPAGRDLRAEARICCPSTWSDRTR